MQAVETLLRWMVRLAAALGVLSLVALMGLTVVTVVFRAVGIAFPGTYVLAELLLIPTVSCALAFAAWAALAHYQALEWIWPVALFEQFTDGLSTVAFFTLMMDYCRDGHEGSDYTMQASVRLFAVGIFTLSSGFSAAWLGYDGHFLLAAALVAVVIPLAWRWQPPATAQTPH